MNVRVPVFGTVGKSVSFDPQAGERALAAVEALAEAIDAGVGGTIFHSSLKNLQVGDDHPQYTMWAANETIDGTWNFATIPLIQGETLAEYIEDVVGSEFFDFIQDTPSIKWTYHETANELEANVDLDWAPVWTNNHRWTDNDEIQLGTGGDLRLYHDGTNSFITNATGYVQMQGSVFRAVPDSAVLPSAAINADSVFAVGRDSASVSIGLVAPRGGSNGFRFVCAAGGLSALAAINTVDNSYLGYIGGSGYDGTNWQTGAAGLFGIRPGSTWSGTNRETFLAFETTASGSTSRTRKARLTSGGNFDLEGDNFEVRLGASQDLRLFHDGTNSIIRNDTGLLGFNFGTDTWATMASNGQWIFQGNSLVIRAPTASSDAVAAFEADGGFNADFRFRTRSSVNRWLMRKNSAAESGSNAGSDFDLVARADDGSNLGNALRIFRATGISNWGFGAGSHMRLIFDGQELTLGAGNDLRLSHDGTNSIIRNDTGELHWQFSTTVSAAVEATAAFDMRQQIQRSNVISPTQLAANTDNWNPTGLATASTIRLSTDASRNITGIVAQPAGTEITLCNVGAQDAVLVHDATSTAANRFLCPGSANFTLNANDSVRIWYDTTSSRWRVIEA